VVSRPVCGKTLSDQRTGLDYESGGQEFESLRARHQLFDFDSEFLRDFFSLDIGWSQGSTGATQQVIWEAGEISARLNHLSEKNLR
jgi:hypothetical protein